MFSATPPGFQNAPVSKILVVGTFTLSLITSIIGIKHYFFLQLDPQIWRWGQWWRLLVWQIVYLNESEVLFSSLLLYNLRVIERLLGSRKFASMILLAIGYSFVLAPCLLITMKIVPSYTANYLPPGPTPIVFAILAQYHHLIPSVYKFRISSSSQPNQQRQITFSDKIFIYILASQLALGQMPGSLITSFTGWLVGVLWNKDVLPSRSWRIPAWWWERRAFILRGNSLDRRNIIIPGITTNPSVAGTQGTTADNDETVAANDINNNDGTPVQARQIRNQILDTFRGSF
ncbi:hypothetical protein V1511DRAFT_455694 [Dipodascopsis uninucleata]